MQILSKSDGTKFAEVGLHAEFWDWDADGDLDLITSSIMKGLRIYTNNGTASEPEFDTDGETIMAGDKTTVGEMSFDEPEDEESDEQSSGSFIHAQPVMHDWDGDGLDDLLIGGSNMETVNEQIVWCRNTGKSGSPVFASPEILFETSPEDEADMSSVRLIDDGEIRQVGTHLRFAVGDVTGDGLDDLVVGDSCYSVGLLKSVVDGDEKVAAAYENYQAAADAMQDAFSFEAAEIMAPAEVADDAGIETDDAEESDGEVEEPEAEAFDEDAFDSVWEAEMQATENLLEAYKKAVGLQEDETLSAKGRVWLLERR